jgi:hypothetical protein
MTKAARRETQENKSTRHQKPVTGKSVTSQKEYGGPKGKEPTRYGDWEKKGRCIDF